MSCVPFAPLFPLRAQEHDARKRSRSSDALIRVALTRFSSILYSSRSTPVRRLMIAWSPYRTNRPQRVPCEI